MVIPVYKLDRSLKVHPHMITSVDKGNFSATLLGGARLLDYGVNSFEANSFRWRW